MRLPGTVALVTGGSSGIGAATARALAAAGARPLIAGRDPARLAAVARETGGLALAADLAAAGGPAELAGAALQAAGPGGIDLLVNNAGIGWAGPIEQMTGQQAAGLIAVDLAAPVELTRLLVPGMIARGRGHIVFVTSIAGATGVRGEAVYSAVKAGLGCFAESLAYELADRGVRVSVIVPGVIDTPFFERRGRPYGRRRPAPLPSQKVANALVSAIERNQYMVFVPRWLGLPAWLHGAAPGVFRRLAGRFG
jgi:NAD(P)-dependent dehydrogenase (short-subunit alcohol dehydrogenase family)